MNTLTYGLQVPEDDDLGDEVFPAMEANLTQLDAHTHNGITSPRLDRKAVDSISQALVASGWVATSGGNYRQAVSMPAGLAYATISIQTRLTATGNMAYLTIEKISATSFYVYINDNTLDVTVLYG